MDGLVLPGPGLGLGMTPHHVHMLWHLTSPVPCSSQLFLTVRLNPTAPRTLYLNR